MDNQDWEAQDRIREEVRHLQQIRIKDNVIKDLEISNRHLSEQIGRLLTENHGLRRALEMVQVSSITYNPDQLIKLQELRNCGEQLQLDLEGLRESFKRD